MNRPNAIAYLTINGMHAGIIMFSVYTAILFSLGVASVGISPQYVTVSSVLVAGLFIGAPAGIALGFLCGFAVDWQVRRQAFPLTAEGRQQLRKQSFQITIMLISIASAWGFVPAFAGIHSWPLQLFGVAVSMIWFNLVGCWVVDRYLHALATWSKPKRVAEST